MKLPYIELPDELIELKLRLRLELDSNITDRVIDEWYKEGQENDKKNEEYWRHWALQNIS